MQESTPGTLSDSQYRAIWAECYELWLECKAGSTGSVRARIGAVDFGRPVEEYCADLFVVARRKLTLYELVIFTRAYIWQWDPHRCWRSLKIDRMDFYRQAEGIQLKLGRAFCENGLRPIHYFRPRRMTPLAIPPGPFLLDSPAWHT